MIELGPMESMARSSNISPRSWMDNTVFLGRVPFIAWECKLRRDNQKESAIVLTSRDETVLDLRRSGAAFCMARPHRRCVADC